jgi:hypothetical protein
LYTRPKRDDIAVQPKGSIVVLLDGKEIWWDEPVDEVIKMLDAKLGVCIYFSPIPGAVVGTPGQTDASLLLEYS